MPMVQTGLRERKKNITRATIAATAGRLFAEHGYDSVSLERIADECTLSVKTLGRYFTSKERLALHRVLDALDRFEAGLRERDGSALAYYRSYLHEQVHEQLRREDALRRFEDLLVSNASLEAHSVALQRRFEDLLTEAFTEETGDGTVRPRLLAAMLIGGNAAVFRHWYTTGARWDPDEFLAVVDTAAAMFGQVTSS